MAFSFFIAWTDSLVADLHPPQRLAGCVSAVGL